MKKQKISGLYILTAVFSAFILGLFLGKNLNDSAVIVSIPSEMQTMPSETAFSTEDTPTETSVTITFPININQATKEELMELPGIGEVLAGRILAYREEAGSFTSLEGLMNVEGIGEKRMEDILDLIVIGGE